MQVYTKTSFSKIKSATSLPVFRRQLKTHIFDCV